MDLSQLAVLALVSLFGAVLQAAFGFGYAILAAPIFLGVMDSLAAVQVLVVLHVVLSAIVVPQIWKGVPLGVLGWLMAGSLLGFPAGLALFLRADVQTLKLAVGIATILFALLLVKREWGAATPAVRSGPIQFRRLSALAIGLTSGALTAVLVMPGPPAMLYLSALGFAKQPSRAAALTFFAFCYVMTTALHAFFGGMQAESWLTALYLLPSVLVGSLVGNWAARYLSEERYRTSVLGLLVISGAFAIWSSLR